MKGYQMLIAHELPRKIIDTGFTFPKAYYRTFELGLINLDPWQFLGTSQYGDIHRILGSMYQETLFVPFARRVDNDDVACFVASSNQYMVGQIAIIHLYGSPGHEGNALYETFWDWFRLAVEEMIEVSQGLEEPGAES